MFRSLHMKLVMIMLLLVTSLMAVVGAFLMTSITNFYIDDFYEQMSEVFGESNAAFVSSLREEAAQEDGAARLQTMLEAYSGTLSIDSRNRNYYVLDGRSGEVLASSNEDGQLLEQTENILTARNGEVGDHSDLAASYMDVAIPISGGDNSFIIYIRDSRTTVSSLNSELLFIILQALLVGLLVSVLLSFLLAKTMIDPIEKLTEGAERIATGDFDETLAVESTDEIGVLTTTFNDMASVLHSTLEAVENERNKLDTLFLHMSDGVVAYDGSGKLILTGNLGDVMKESVQAAVSYLRTRAEQLHIPSDFYKTRDIHVHFPEGAVPKDGPSAGIAVCTALASALSGTPVRRDIAMTGEISIRGRVLPIGGLKEKILAAKMAHIKKVLVPDKNRPDMAELSKEITRGLEIVYVKNMDEVIKEAFV